MLGAVAPLTAEQHRRALAQTDLGVRLVVPSQPGYVGTYARVQVVIDHSTGFTIDDLEFVVPDGLKGGAVSDSRDVTFQPEEPHVLLLYGYEPGTYAVQALKSGTNTLLGDANFEVTDQWADDVNGPSLWFNGVVKTPLALIGGTWGGGSTGPQNVNTIPAAGARRVAVLLVDTSGQRYTTDGPTLSGFRTRWQQHLVDGVTGADGVVRSVRQFYREVSYWTADPTRGLDLSGTVFTDVVHLPNGWSSYFSMDQNNNWQAKGNFVNQCIIAAGSTVDLTGFDMIVCVSQAVTGASPIQVAWPYGGYGVNVLTAHGRVTGRGVSMPNEWGDGSGADQGGGRTIYETLSHELGHTIALPDEYGVSATATTPAITGTLGGVPNPGSSWDPMAFEQPFPHFTVAHRMMLGWVQPAWVRSYDFQALGTTVDDTVTLQAIELGAPPAGRVSGIEVRIGDGRNYYFEYRIGEPMQIGDEQLLPNARVVGTDVTEPPDPPTASRRDILLLPQHSDDSGGVLDTGQFYHEVDNSSPTFPSDFRVDVVSRDNTSAVIRVRYGVVGKPDPSIRPWPGNGNYQSPDIEVQNARSLADPANWANVPWSGHTNTVIAQVKNRGTLSAPGVVANFYVKDYTVGGAPETFLGFDRHDLAPGATAPFSTTWIPPVPSDPTRPQHYCIVVRIDPYQTPTSPPVPELTDANNVAQSNYDRFISATASPPSRERTTVTIGNPYDRPTRFFIDAGQDNPLYRTYLENTWVVLKPNETRQVLAMFEYAPGAEQIPPLDPDERQKLAQVSNGVAFLGQIENPNDSQLHGPSPFAGAGAQIATGSGTEFESFDASGGVASGRIIVTSTKKGVPGGTVVLITTIEGRDGEEYEQVPVDSDGAFKWQLPGGWMSVQGYYVPLTGYGDATSRLVTR